MTSKTALKARVDHLSKNYALVTGASSGLGWYLSDALVRRGYNLIAVSNQPEELGELKKKLEQSYPVSVVTVNMDLAEDRAAKSIFEYCEKHRLQVDVLVNNAGMLIYGEALSVEYLRTQSILQLHMTTPALLCRLFGEKMMKRRKGYILNVSSISAVMPYPTISFYGPTKSFLRNFSRALRTELKPMGVNVTCLLPGAMDTRLLQEYHFNLNKAKKVRVVEHPEKVAREGIKALFRNRSECIPGMLNKLTVWLLPLVPQFIIGLIYKRSRPVS
jgi:short-subunit dehydrogenase